jgi:uncharacterized membrane protein YphA (DoxX/SURF4 family)
LWILIALLALTFATTGVSKLAGVSPSPENFARWGYSMTFMRVIGAVELIGAIGLVVPRSSPFAAAGLIVPMIGALRTGIAFGEPLHIALPLVLITLLVVVVVSRRGHLARASK